MQGDVLTGLGKESDQVVQMIFSCNLHFQKKNLYVFSKWWWQVGHQWFRSDKQGHGQTRKNWKRHKHWTFLFFYCSIVNSEFVILAVPVKTLKSGSKHAFFIHWHWHKKQATLTLDHWVRANHCRQWLWCYKSQATTQPYYGWQWYQRDLDAAVTQFKYKSPAAVAAALHLCIQTHNSKHDFSVSSICEQILVLLLKHHQLNAWGGPDLFLYQNYHAIYCAHVKTGLLVWYAQSPKVPPGR